MSAAQSGLRCGDSARTGGYQSPAGGRIPHGPTPTGGPSAGPFDRFERLQALRRRLEDAFDTAMLHGDTTRGEVLFTRERKVAAAITDLMVRRFTGLTNREEVAA